MKCKFSRLDGVNVRQIWLSVLLGTTSLGCPASGPTRDVDHTPVLTPSQQPSLPLDRIAVVGASVSAGFGGMSFGQLVTAAAKRSKVEAYANLFLFRDPIGDTRSQIDQAIGFRATTIIGLDLLFWDVYRSTDPAWRDRAVTAALGELERARVAGAWIVVGDVPRITTANEAFIAKESVPDVATIARYNDQIAAWARRERVLLIPFASWAEPLAAGGVIELRSGEKIAASALVGPDGLHANALGAWALLDRLDAFIERALPGTAPDALVFERPSIDRAGAESPSW